MLENWQLPSPDTCNEKSSVRVIRVVFSVIRVAKMLIRVSILRDSCVSCEYLQGRVSNSHSSLGNQRLPKEEWELDTLPCKYSHETHESPKIDTRINIFSTRITENTT